MNQENGPENGFWIKPVNLYHHAVTISLQMEKSDIALIVRMNTQVKRLLYLFYPLGRQMILLKSNILNMNIQVNATK